MYQAICSSPWLEAPPVFQPVARGLGALCQGRLSLPRPGSLDQVHLRFGVRKDQQNPLELTDIVTPEQFWNEFGSQHNLTLPRLLDVIEHRQVKLWKTENLGKEAYKGLLVYLYNLPLARGEIARALKMNFGTVTNHLDRIPEVRARHASVDRAIASRHKLPAGVLEAFGELNREEAAYWLGFIAADGNVASHRQDGRHSYAIRVVSNDKEHLKRWARYVGASVSPQGFSHEVSFSNVLLAQVLETWGIVPRKSNIMELPPNLSRIAFGPYLRGLFDGDGSITLQKSPYQPVGALTITSGSRGYLDALSQRLSRDYQIESEVVKRKHLLTGDTYDLKFKTNRLNVLRLFNLMYGPGKLQPKVAHVFLDRKARKFIQMIDGCETLLKEGKTWYRDVEGHTAPQADADWVLREAMRNRDRLLVSPEASQRPRLRLVAFLARNYPGESLCLEGRRGWIHCIDPVNRVVDTR